VKPCMKLRVVMLLTALLLTIGFGAPAQAAMVDIFVDSAPNVYGSPDYAAWEAAAFAAAADGSFINMANSANPGFAGTTQFMLADEVVYSFGDLGHRLTWVYWIPGATVADLEGLLEVSLINTWDGDVDDFYLSYYGSTWLTPTKIYNYYDDTGEEILGVVGIAGMAWWGAHNVNTQEALDADMAAWSPVDESWEFKVRLDGEETSLVSTRSATPEPASMLLFGSAIAGFAAYRRRQRKKEVS
jgi:hypothetical protein